MFVQAFIPQLFSEFSHVQLFWERMAGKIQEEAATPSEKGLRLQTAQQAGEIYRRPL